MPFACCPCSFSKLFIDVNKLFARFYQQYLHCSYYFSEIYARQTNEPLATNLFQPSCTCPRQPIDSFGLLAAIDEDVNYNYLCHSLISSLMQSNSRRYEGYDQGKWAIFTNSGWLSDFTSAASIYIHISQPMLVRMGGSCKVSSLHLAVPHDITSYQNLDMSSKR